MTFCSAHRQRPDVARTRSSRQNTHPSECSPFHIFPHVHSRPSVSARRRFSPPPSAPPCLLFTPFAVTLSCISERLFRPFNTCVLLTFQNPNMTHLSAWYPQTTSRRQFTGHRSAPQELSQHNPLIPVSTTPSSFHGQTAVSTAQNSLFTAQAREMGPSPAPEFLSLPLNTRQSHCAPSLFLNEVVCVYIRSQVSNLRCNLRSHARCTPRSSTESPYMRRIRAGYQRKVYTSGDDYSRTVVGTLTRRG